MDETPEALEQATQLVKTGHLAEARNSLLQYLRQNPNSEQAWLLMSYTVSDQAQQKDCLERVLKINPENAMARSKLTILTNPPTALPSKLAPLKEESFFAPASAEKLPPISFPQPLLPHAEDRPEEEEEEDAILSSQAPADSGILTRLRSRSQSANSSDQISGSQLISLSESSPNNQIKNKSPHQYIPSADDFSEEPTRRNLLPLLLGIFAAIGVLIVTGMLVMNGGFRILLPASTPTSTPTETPIVVSLPPEWTKTALPTETITPTATLTPTITASPTETLVISLTPTKPK